MGKPDRDDRKNAGKKKGDDRNPWLNAETCKDTRAVTFTGPMRLYTGSKFADSLICEVVGDKSGEVFDWSLKIGKANMIAIEHKHGKDLSNWKGKTVNFTIVRANIDNKDVDYIEVEGAQRRD